MKIKSMILVGAALFAANASAQFVTNDAAWCAAVQSALADHGVSARVSSDVEGPYRVLHVTSDGRTRNYTLAPLGTAPDYSTPIGVIVEELIYREPRRDMRISDARAWLGPRSSTYAVEEVFTVPADYDQLENAIRNTIVGVQRMNIVNGHYVNNSLADATPLFVLTTTVIGLQRAESYEKEAAPKDGGKPAGGDRPGQGPGQHGAQQGQHGAQQGQHGGGHPASAVPRKVNRRYAYGKVHVELADYRNGNVVWSHDFSDEDYTSYSYSDPMDNVIGNITRQLGNQLQSLFPATAPREAVSGSVVQTVDVKKNKVQSLYINLGSDQRLRKGDVLPVYVVNNVGGYFGTVQVGSVTVSEVQGGSLSLCKVKRGEKEIFNALNSGAQLVVEGNLD